MVKPGDKVEKASAVGSFTWEDMTITWALYEAREMQRSLAEKMTLLRPIRIKCEFRATDGIEYEAMGEFAIDPIRFQRMTEEEWLQNVVRLAKVAVKAAAEHEAKKVEEPLDETRKLH